MTDQLTESWRLPAADLTLAWAGDPRWSGIKRSYTAQDVVKLRGTVQERTPWPSGAPRRLWELLHARTTSTRSAR
jgi:isocitrate lyase